MPHLSLAVSDKPDEIFVSLLTCRSPWSHLLPQSGNSIAQLVRKVNNKTHEFFIPAASCFLFAQSKDFLFFCRFVCSFIESIDICILRQ